MNWIPQRAKHYCRVETSMTKSPRHIYHADARPKNFIYWTENNNCIRLVYIFYVSELFLTDYDCVHKLVKHYSKRSDDVLVVVNENVRNMIFQSSCDDVRRYLTKYTEPYFDHLKHILNILNSLKNIIVFETNEEDEELARRFTKVTLNLRVIPT